MLLPLWVPLLILACLLGMWAGVVRHLHRLEPLPDAGEATLGPVCLCIPARNEAAELGRALDSWLAQDLPGLRIVVVDDGSTDATPEILAARACERLAALRIDHLPSGWLGKNHALDQASRHPWALEAEWLLFVDADVRAEADLLRRVAAYLASRETDVLALFPGVDAVTWPERLFVGPGSTLVLLAVNPAAVADPRRWSACGIGAFTLLRRGVYDAIGGHAAAPLEAIDDMALAFRAKRSGARNRVAQGGPGLRLRMYHGLGDLLRGIRKNILGMPRYPLLLPLVLGIAPALTLSPLWLWAGGWPEAGLAVWLLFPAVVGTVHQRISARPAELTWALWPLLGPILAAGALLALWDRLRGRNVWRGRAVSLEPQ